MLQFHEKIKFYFYIYKTIKNNKSEKYLIDFSRIYFNIHPRSYFNHI